jgi:DNA-binding transcriptional MerR regulator
MQENGHSESAVPNQDLFRIGEVSRLTATKQFVLRYWETEFPMLQPVKSPKGHRLYRREDIDTVLRIKRLLYDEGFTIAGARRHLRDTPPNPAGVPAGTTHRENGLREDYVSEAVVGDQAVPSAELIENRAPREAPVNLSRKTLMDLRDALRSFLTLLERE